MKLLKIVKTVLKIMAVVKYNERPVRKKSTTVGREIYL